MMKCDYNIKIIYRYRYRYIDININIDIDMYSYLKNITSDIIYGYVDVKCANKNCNRIYKFARNNLDFNTNNYCCNMGCALSSYNQDQEKSQKESSDGL